MIVSLIGNGNLNKFSKILGLSKEELKEELRKVAVKLAELGVEIYLVPEGTQKFIAEEYKKAGGKKVIGSVPLDDKIWGVSFLDLNLPDEIINCGDWFKQPYFIINNPDAILMLGMGQMTIGELGYLKYNYKYLNKPTPLFIYSPLLRQKQLPIEFSFDIQELITYIDSVEELQKITNNP